MTRNIITAPWEERMRDRYIAFDVETPNCANDRMSAIGLLVAHNAPFDMSVPAKRLRGDIAPLFPLRRG